MKSITQNQNQDQDQDRDQFNPSPSQDSDTSSSSAFVFVVVGLLWEAKALADIWHFSNGPGWEKFFIYEKEQGLWTIRRGRDDLVGILEEVHSKVGDWFFSPHAYLPRGGRTEENIVQLNAIVIDLDNDDLELEEALARLRECGLKPHYVIGTSPGRWQLILREEPIRLGKRNRKGVLRRQREVIRSLYELAGGDLSAAKVNQLFRLPGSRRQLADGVWDVRIWERSKHPAYTLERLERAVAVAVKRRSTFSFRGYRPAKDQGRRNGHVLVLNSPALQWLQNHVIAEGFRNTALVAMTYAAAMDGLTYEEALPRLLRWVEEHTQGPYPRHEAEQVIRSCYRDPKGLDWRRLLSIQDVSGKRMTEAQARSVLKAMPRTRQVHSRLPVDQLRNRPLFESLMKVLKTLAWLQLQRRNHHHNHSYSYGPVCISSERLANMADVPLETLKKRLLPILDHLKIRKVKRYGRSYVSTYDLRKLPPPPVITYAFTRSNSAIQGLFRRPIENVVRYWARRFKDLWEEFISLLKRISAVFTRTRAGVGEGEEPDPGGRRLSPRRSRGPPQPPPRAEDRADFGVTLGGLSPVLPRRLERELEKQQQRRKLLEEWSKLTPEEIERRKEARLEVARRWALELEAEGEGA